ncbi:Uncharacterized protein EJ110_NYTH17496 [Nymphaea thermarum]|nr:Uncharacterized protein EJ110_NYTH17496 [Nymphaea thermarum]
MDCEVNEALMQDVSCLGTEEDVDHAAIGNGKCGICMDDVIDRGVLDCCNHWFCFTCVDNWATITNFCPLCKNEFKLITCIPVYDTIGGLKGKECTISRYHAFCVGFDPNSSYGSSWLCPRCNVAEVLEKLDSISSEKSNKNFVSEVVSSLCPTETTLSGKLAVSVADAGETAIVISLVDGKELTDDGENVASEILSDIEEKHDEALPIVLGTNNFGEFVPRPASCFLDDCGWSNLQSCGSVSTPTTEILNGFSCGEQENAHEKKMHVPADGQGTSLSLPLSEDLLLLSASKSSQNAGEPEPSICNLSKTLGPNFGASTVQDRQALDTESRINLNPALMVEPYFRVHDKTCKKDEFEESSQKNLDDAGVSGKCMDKSRDVMQLNDQEEHSQTLRESETRTVHKKRIRSEGNSEMLKLNSEDDASGSDSSDRYSKRVTCLKSKKVRKTSVKEENLSDIMSLVKEVGPESLHELASPIRGARATKTKGNAAGLRIKKIMRRGVDDYEASELVQKIKKEVDDAVNDGALETAGKGDLLDLKLLTAFRAAIAKPSKEQDKKVFASLAKAKQSLLQKGKIRENLTRKLYGTANGRRRRAWDRDWEIEFWKHRCLHTNSEKVETLQSVLEQLRKNPESWSKELKIENMCDEEETNPILSRLYLADASVLPRKEDIKPLSALTTSSKDEPEKMNDSSNVSQPTGVTSAKMHKQSSTTLSHGTFSPSKARTLSDKAHGGLAAQGAKTCSTSSSHNTHIMKEAQGTSGDVKADKRKWALAVLARKSAMTDRDKSGEVDEHYLHGNFPLLAQLPADMRPTLAPSRQSKVPTSIRQGQLNRLVEHYLKKANLRTIHRCAETELAVADALNVEKQIHGRSKSRIVYLNLCSQAISQHVAVGNSREEEAPSDVLVKVMEGSCDEASCGHESDSVTQALRLAGLLSESPSNSPYQSSEDTDRKSDHAVKDGDYGCEDVLNLESRPEIDIYGDFDYDLDEDFMGLSEINSSLIMSRSQLDVSTDSKVKVVLSTLNHENDSMVTESIDAGAGTILEGEKVDKISLGPGSFEHVCLVKPEAHHDYLKLAVPCDDEGRSNSLLHGENTNPNEASNDLSVAEYEELYGRDEPEKIYGNKSIEYMKKCMGKQSVGEEIVHEKNQKCKQNNLEVMLQTDNECYAENNVIETGGTIKGRTSRADNSPTHSMMSENAPKKCEASNQQTDQSPIHKKVEAYIKEHIRPLCKSGVITVEQYRWAVSKTTDKVMQYHCKAKSADFLIKEGPKVRKLAEQYVESAKQRCSRPSSLHGN